MRQRSDDRSLYAAACTRAVTAGVDQAGPENSGRCDPTRLARECADDAMSLLKQAVGTGYKNADHMNQDKDLDALGECDDFKKLLAEVAAKQPSETSKPKESGQP
jgi:hypothetical protein